MTHPAVFSRRKFHSNKKPYKWHIVMWDTVTDKEKIVSPALTENQADTRAWAMEKRNPRMSYSMWTRAGKGNPPW